MACSLLRLSRRALVSLGLSIVAVASACPTPARAQAIADTAVYAFAQQKVYGMTMTATPGSSATLVGTAFGVKMSTKAAWNTLHGVVAHNGGLDATQSFIGSGSPPQPVENYSGNAFAGMSLPPNERVLLQANPTPPGTPQSIDLSVPTGASFFAGRDFARSDAYTTVNPDTTVAPPGSGTIPADTPPGTWPAEGNGVAAAKLFAPIGTPGTLSIDLVAESLLNGEGYATISSAVADWVVSGGFTIAGDASSRAAVSLDFNIVERMVVSSWSPQLDVATSSNAFAMDVLDKNGISVFGPFLGANPSITRLLSTGVFAAATYNNHTLIPTHVYPGPVIVNFQTLPLAPGDYTFTVKGTTTAYVTAVPEPSTGLSLAIAAVGLAAWRWRRRG
ncbi:MAG: PEP-CTERM sorting domain-containing protein [Planctomycetota bacterium]